MRQVRTKLRFVASATHVHYLWFVPALHVQRRCVQNSYKAELCTPYGDALAKLTNPKGRYKAELCKEVCTSFARADKAPLCSSTCIISGAPSGMHRRCNVPALYATYYLCSHFVVALQTVGKQSFLLHVQICTCNVIQNLPHFFAKRSRRCKALLCKERGLQSGAML